MARRTRLTLALLTGLLAPSCADETDLMDEAACESVLNGRPYVDAIEWLKTPSAGPKFRGANSDVEALAFALKLQELGATRMAVIEDDRAGLGPPGAAVPTRAGMVVELPEDRRKRMALFRLYAKQVRSLGIAPRPDTGQRYFFVPWARGETSHRS